MNVDKEQVEELEKKRADLFAKAQWLIQEHYKFMGRIDEINEQIEQLRNGKEKQEKQEKENGGE